MKNLNYLILAATLVVFTYCRPEKKSTVVTNVAAPTQPSANTPPNTGDPVPLTTSPDQNAAPVNPVGLNPAHGLPGHRCDIPVGARLDAPPQSNPTAAPRLPAPTLPLPSAPGLVAAGTNPPHGQPGHDCSIPVGAPLKN